MRVVVHASEWQRIQLRRNILHIIADGAATGESSGVDVQMQTKPAALDFMAEPLMALETGNLYRT